MEGPDPKKRKKGWGHIMIYPTLYATEKKFIKELKKLLPYINKEEIEAVVSNIKTFEATSVLVDEKTYRKLERGVFLFESVDHSIDRGADCSCGDFLQGCSCGVHKDTNLKDYLILSPEDPHSEGWRRIGRYSDVEN